MHRNRTRWTGRQSRALARCALALALVLAAGLAGAAARREAPTDRVIVKFKDTPLLASSASATGPGGRDRVDSLSIRTATPMRYLRTMFNGAHAAHLGRYMQGAQLDAVLARLAADTQVEAVYADRLERIASTVPDDPRFGNNNGDPNGQFTQQWYLMAPNTTLISPINAVAAWDLSRGVSVTTKSPVVVAVVDTGVLYRHPDLGTVGKGGKLLPGFDMVGPDAGSSNPPTYFVANDGDGADPDPSDPGDWINTTDITSPATKTLFAGSGCTTVSPSSWHGTMVAGIIGAATNDGIGIAGVGWDAQVLPMRALGKCAGYISDILDAMAWAVGLPVPVPDTTSPYYVKGTGFAANPVANRSRIINLSLGDANPCDANSAYQLLIPQLIAMDVIVVAAAGNDGTGVWEPASCAGVISVSALRHLGTKVAFSNFGGVTISAPGGNCVNAAPPCLYSIVTTASTDTESPTDGGMTYIDGHQASVTYSGQTFAGGGAFGTSFAAPMVSGVVALMLAVNPALTRDQVITMLQSSARPFPAPPAGVVSCTDPSAGVAPGKECGCTTTTCGAGMLDAYQAVLAAMGNPANPTVLPPPTPIQAPVIPPPPAAASGGGGGATAPWWILLLLALAAVRARTARVPGSGGRVLH